MLDKAQFIEVNLRLAASLAADHGARLGQGADGFIESRVRAAAEEYAGAQPDRQAKMLADIDIAIRKLIDAMAASVDTIPGYRIANPGVFGEQTLGAALKSLCPIWPFC